MITQPKLSQRTPLRPAAVLLGLLLAAAGAGVHAQGQNLSRSDRNFIEEAAAGGMAEVAAGKVAQQKASDPQVKQFADRMVQDHSQSNEELKSLAAAKGVTLPAEMPRKHGRDLAKLEKRSGAEFDREYMDHMVADHRKTVSMFEKQAGARNGDADVKAFASKTLPTLQQHLQMARTLEDSVKKSARSGAGMPPATQAQGTTPGTPARP